MVAFNSSSPAAPFLSLAFVDGAVSVSPSQLAARHDAGLVDRFKAGDDAAFTEIISRHREKMLAVALSRLHNHGDAEEIVQDTFIRAHRGLADFRGDSSLSTWLHRIAGNLALNRYWYFFRRQRHTTQSLDRPFAEGGTGTLADVMAGDGPSPAQEAMLEEFTVLVAAGMRKLPPDHWEILRLRTVQNHSYAEIALTLGVKVGTVKSRIARARVSLHTLVNDSCPDFDVGILGGNERNSPSGV